MNENTDDILERIDLRRLYPELWGNPVMVPCPAHSDKKKPNLGVYARNVFCFQPNCGFHEGAFAYIKRVKGLASMKDVVAEALKLCSAEATPLVNVEPPLPLEKGVAVEYSRRLQERPEKLIWLNEKYGLTPDTVYRAGMGYTGAHPFAYTLPVFSLDSSLVNIRFRVDPVEEKSSPVKYWGIRGRNQAVFYLPPPLHKQGKSYIASALDSHYGKHNVILTEGEFDALALSQLGIPAISATNGAQSLVGAHAYLVEELRGCRVYVAYDQDEVGRAMGLQVLLSLKDSGIRATLLEWDADAGKDASELVVAGWSKADWLKLAKSGA